MKCFNWVSDTKIIDWVVRICIIAGRIIRPQALHKSWLTVPLRRWSRNTFRSSPMPRPRSWPTSRSWPTPAASRPPSRRWAAVWRRLIRWRRGPTILTSAWRRTRRRSSTF